MSSRNGHLDETPLEAARVRADLTLPQLWLRCLSIGGVVTEADLRESLAGRRGLSGPEYDVIAQALNDHFTAQGLDHPVPYTDQLP
jgi:hypothetical protein